MTGEEPALFVVGYLTRLEALVVDVWLEDIVDDRRDSKQRCLCPSLAVEES